MSMQDLGDHYERWIDSLVASGRYATRRDVLRDSLRLLEERERLAQLRALIAEGDESGDAEPLDMDAIKAEARARHRQSLA